MPDDNDLSRRRMKSHLQPRRESRFKVRPIAVVPSDDIETILLSKESLLDESEFLYRTPKATSRQSIYNRQPGRARIPMDLLMMPPLGEAATGAPVPRLVANPRLN